jgi:hypothetical protein
MTINKTNQQNRDKLARKITDKTNAVFLSLPRQTRQFYHTESLRLPEDATTAAMLRTVMTGTHYYSIRNLFSFAINCSLSSMKVHSHL